jgi:Protein of unknown function (DUF3489)
MSKRPNSRSAQTATSNPAGQVASARNSAATKAAKSEGGRTTKQARVVALLRSPAGATIAMMKATEWQQHSVRGFLTGAVRKKLKLKLNSTKSDGERVYRIVASGRSRSKPAPHTRHRA